jgi:Recombinase
MEVKRTCRDCRRHIDPTRLTHVRHAPFRMAAARARGVILGGMREKSLELQAEAEARAEELRSVLVELVGLSHRAAARTLNERGVKTATGKPWSPVTVTRVRQRLGLI